MIEYILNFFNQLSTNGKINLIALIIILIVLCIRGIEKLVDD